MGSNSERQPSDSDRALDMHGRDVDDSIDCASGDVSLLPSRDVRCPGVPGGEKEKPGIAGIGHQERNRTAGVNGECGGKR